MISDREVTFFLALGELLADIEQPKRLIEKKLDAFRKARGLTEEYVRRGIREDLVGVILKKKLALILIAKTADEVERAANPHRPQYDFGHGVKTPLRFRRRSWLFGASSLPTTCCDPRHRIDIWISLPECFTSPESS